MEIDESFELGDSQENDFE